jgi:O-antigen/teichoic acid export membrane protein
MSLKKNFVWLLAGRGISVSCIFLTGMVVNRALGPYYRGIFAEVQTWIGFFIVLFGLSLNSVIYHFSNRKRFGNDDKIRFAASTFLTLTLAILAAVFLTGYVLLKPQHFSNTAHTHIAVISGILIFTMLSTNWTIFLQSLNHIKLSAYALAVPSLFNIAILYLAFVSKALNIGFLLLAMLLVQMLSAAVLFFMFSKLALLHLRFSPLLALDMVKAGIKQHGATVATFFYTKINQLILFRYCGAEDTGYFSVSLTLAMAAMIIPMTFQNILYPRVIHATDDFEVTLRSLRVVFYGWGAAVIGMLFLAKPIIYLYGGSKFLPTVNNFRILSVAFLFLALSAITAPYVIKLGAFVLSSVSAVSLGIISIILNFILIPRYAAVGAAFATLCTCIAGFCLALFLIGYLSKRNPLRFLIIQG